MVTEGLFITAFACQLHFGRDARFRGGAVHLIAILRFYIILRDNCEFFKVLKSWINRKISNFAVETGVNPDGAISDGVGPRRQIGENNP